jgi:hypothetical protein
MQDDGDWDDRPKDVDQHRDLARATP